MSFSFAVRESLSGFMRAKLSTFISITTITISLLLLGVFAVLTINTSRFISGLRTKVELEAFVQEPATKDELATLQKRLAAINGVERVTFVSKEEAAKIFKEEFGEDITSVLEFNPLPPSFKIALKDEYRTAARADSINTAILAMQGIDKVIYRKALLELLDERTATIHNMTLGLGVLISLSAIFLVSNTIRLAIHAKRKLLRTMQLVGATASFIRLPFLLEGILQGFLGGVLASGCLYLLLEYAARLLSREFADYIHMDAGFYLAVIAAGVTLGLVGSIISVLRFIRLAESA